MSKQGFGYDDAMDIPVEVKQAFAPLKNGTVRIVFKNEIGEQRAWECFVDSPIAQKIKELLSEGA